MLTNSLHDPHGAHVSGFTFFVAPRRSQQITINFFTFVTGVDWFIMMDRETVYIKCSEFSRFGRLSRLSRCLDCLDVLDISRQNCLERLVIIYYFKAKDLTFF